MANIYYKNGSSWTSLLSIVYPVGSIYLTINNTSPANLVGGTWNELKGRYYLRSYTESDTGYDNPGATGGSNYLTVRNLPSHAHAQNRYTFLSRNGAEKKFASVSQGYFIGTVAETGEALTQSTGGGEIYLPAYYVVHIWRRTA